ncbi:MAG: bifunctional folylpolyglutamate synthase/dihydrofolate synthase [Deltaproteobacteria bacterium]|nr:bifunctional folylpolyglutamate synthase/dihydrofolate synthase [Deltaproteobacteria bacterium]
MVCDLGPSSRQLEALYGISSVGISLGLDRIERACARLGHPQKNLASVQVAGTNGKGSVSTMLARAFEAAGLRVGLFTSPHIHRFTERIRIQGEEIDLDELSVHLEQVLQLTRGEDAIALTFFEVATLAALLVFQSHSVDVAVLEVGLGGRLDATSVVTPRVGVITSIALDHTGILGETIAEIAAEKAGIIKPDMVLCCGRVCDVAREVIGAKAALHQVEIVDVREAHPQLCAALSHLPFFRQAHQQENAALALEAFCRFLGDRPPTALQAVFADAMASFRIPCRFERIDTDAGRFLIDGAHNMEAMGALVSTIQSTGMAISQIGFGALKGKPADEMIQLLLSVCPRVTVVPAPIDRNMDTSAFAQKWQLPESTIAEAVGRHKGPAVMLVTGSFFVAAEARRILLQTPADPPVGL